MQEAHITVRAIVPVVAALKALGHDASAVLRAGGIDALVLDAADGRVAHSAMMRLRQQAQIETGDAYLGLHLAQAAPLESFELHAYALMASRDLRDAFRRGCRYQRLIHETTSLDF